MNPVVTKLINALNAEVTLHRHVETIAAEEDRFRQNKKKVPYLRQGIHVEIQERKLRTDEALRNYKHLKEFCQLQGQDIP